jgi:chromosome segregation ATPase
MRNALIVVSLLCVILVVSVFRVRSNAASQLESAQKVIDGFSNKVTEAQTRLVMGQALTLDATNKLRAQIEQEMKRGAALSNQLHQARQAATTLRQELDAHTLSLGRNNARVEELESSLQDVKARLEEALRVAGQVEQTRKEAQLTAAERDQALHDTQNISLAKAEIERLLQNPAFLRAQLERLEQQARWAKQAARRNLSQLQDPRAPLQLQPDGSVRVLASTNPPSAGGATPRR